VLLGLLGHPSARPAIAQLPSVGGEHPLIRVEEGMVSVKIAGAPLEEVLREIAAQSRTRLVMHGPRPEKVSAEFQWLPLDKALRRLIMANFLLLYAPGTNGPLVEVWILSPATPLASSPIAAQEPAQHIPSGESDFPDALIIGLQRGNAEQRGRAVLALGDVQDERAVEPVIKALEGDEDPNVRHHATWALKDLGGQRALAALAEAVYRDSDDFVRQSAVDALARLGGQEAVEPLSWALREDPHPFVRYEALMNLAEIGGERVRDILRQALDDPEELVWAKGAELLHLQGARGHTQ
jgi:bilin biosynthesis protein